MKLKRLAASLLSFATMFTTVVPATAVLATDEGLTEYFVGAEREYKTINEALDAVENNKPTGEENRAIINIDPGTYEEQIVIENNLSYVTIQKTPGKEGDVKWSWYYCTGYCFSNVGLDGRYDSDIDWTNDGTWYGYSDVAAGKDSSGSYIKNDEEDFTVYKLGQELTGVTRISYYDKKGVAHKDVSVNSAWLANLGNSGRNLDAMGAFSVKSGSHDITLKDVHIVNSIPVMVTKGEQDAHVTPTGSLPSRDCLTICDEDTEEIYVEPLTTDSKGNPTSYDLTKKYSAGESAYLARSYLFNERGHALSICGDRITLENVYARGNQDSVYIGTGRTYFKNCTLIGGTDYIYGEATAVFDNCKIGWEGMSDRDYGGPITAVKTDANNPYGLLFYNCEIYHVRSNVGDISYGRPWGQAAQVTFFNTTIDDNGTTGNADVAVSDLGWADMSGSKKEEARFFEYGTKKRSGSNVDLNKRVVNTSAGMGTVLDEWQILEFNPRNYFNKSMFSVDEWDPMGFTEQYLSDVDAQMNAADITIPAGNETKITLPESTDSNIEFKWESISDNAAVSDDGKSIEVIRPAFGEDAINTNIVLYAMNKTTGFGDKKIIDVTIAATTDSENVFNIPVTINASTTNNTDCDYTVTITKNGALIKQAVVTINSGKTSATGTIENVPASAAGIDYQVKVVSSSDEFTVTVPEEGKTTLTGKTGVDTPLNITAEKIVDKTVNTGASFGPSTSSGTYKVYDLIALAKTAGASDSIDTSDIIKVEYDLTVTANVKDQNYSYIDLTSKTPDTTCKTAEDAARFVLWRVNNNWNQLDMADGTVTFNGSSNIAEHQWLNVAGKFNFTTVSHISLEINYKTKTMTAWGTGSNNKTETFEFTGFPTNFEKGNLNLAVYPNSANTTPFGISDITVTYKDVVRSSDDNNDDKDDDDDRDITENAAITNVEVLNGNTIVTLKDISDGIVVAAKYEGEKLKEMKTMNVSGDTVTISGIEADSVFVWDSLGGMKPLCKSYVINPKTAGKAFDIDFTGMTEVPVYSAEKGQGFVSVSSSIMPSGAERKVADVANITLSSNGAKVTESNGNYLTNTANSTNYGGLIYRVDTGAAGAYHIEVEVTGSNSDTKIAPTGMDATRLTGTSAWDTAGLVARQTSAKWSGSKWSYDFATGEKFIEIEIEPTALPTSSVSKTVGVKSIKVTPLSVNAEGDKPTIHILGDSTQKTYTFNATISSWGQTLIDYFDTDKVNVINYSMGGRSMKSNYTEGRTDDILIKGKKGDFVFIHSAHNDETNSSSEPVTSRFGRGTNVDNDLTKSNALYNRWLDMYVEAIKARGMIPVLVTAMPRTSNGSYSESTAKPNGFLPDAPGNMRNKAASDSGVGLIELYAGAKAYIDKLDAEEIKGIYNSIEAGEMPGGSDGSSTANGASGDGTHYKESAGRQWCRIMLQSIYDQSVAQADTYTDKSIMTELVGYMKADVKNSAASKDWSKVFPEMASDVSAVDVVPGATKQAKDNYYFRNSIEKVLSLGIMKKDSNNKFYPTNSMTVGEFARSAEKAFGLEENSLSSYNKTYAELQAAGAEEITLASNSPDNKSLKTAINSSSNGNVDLAANEYTVSVTQPTGAVITIYNESDYKTFTVDIKKTITANATISDNDYFTLIAPGAVTSGSDSSGKFSANSDITTDYIETHSGNNKIFVYNAKQTGTLTLYIRAAQNKRVGCGELNNESTEKYIDEDNITGSTNIYKAMDFDVEAGKTYNIYTRGGTGRLFGVMYSSDYKNSTESLSVSNGDEIKVVVQRENANYLVDSILVGGKAVSSATGSNTRKECTFTVSGNTTVSANIVANPEPQYVGETLIASDAVLTREAMAAILYDAYLAKFGRDSGGNWVKPAYMTAYNGGSIGPDDPNYDPNIVSDGGQYYPMYGWDTLTDIDQVNKGLYAKTKEVYNLGLMRSDLTYSRGAVKNGTAFEPKTAVTRARAAKALAFIYILTQPVNNESQVLPEGNLAANTGTIVTPNANAPSTPFEIKE